MSCPSDCAQLERLTEELVKYFEAFIRQNALLGVFVPKMESEIASRAFIQARGSGVRRTSVYFEHSDSDYCHLALARHVGVFCERSGRTSGAR